MQRDEREERAPERAQPRALEAPERALAPGERRARVTQGTRGGVVQRGEEAAAAERVLDGAAPEGRVVLGPGERELAVESVRVALVRGVGDGEEGEEGGPKEEGVEREEGARVEERAGEAG